jgi:uncharacterized protein DUF6252
MKQNVLFLILISCLVCFERCQCKDDDPPPAKPPIIPTCDTCLPEITTTGRNTFGCRVNGKTWLPKGGSDALNVDYFNQHLIVNAFNSGSKQYIDIDFAPITDTVTYNLYTPGLSTQWGRYINSSTTINYNADTIYHGFIHVSKFDPVEGTMSGTFAFDAYNPQGDTVHITDGRFDLHL